MKQGKVTREFGCISEALHEVRKLHESTLVADFGPRALKAVRDAMVGIGWSRKYINKQTGRIVRMFKWGVEEELVPPAVYQALAAVPGLRKGRTDAPDYDPVQPVNDADIEAVLVYLTKTVVDMVRFQRLVGCRPSEVCRLRPMDVDRNREIWMYRPPGHKTEHQGRQRIIFIGPKAQRILAAYLLRATDAYCFSPRESEQTRRQQAHAARVTPLSCGNVPKSGTGRGKRAAGEKFTADTYRQAIHRACDKAGIGRWSPNQLRHSTATEIRKTYGLEAAQVVLGHASADVTQIYAERDQQLAAGIAKEFG